MSKCQPSPLTRTMSSYVPDTTSTPKKSVLSKKQHADTSRSLSEPIVSKTDQKSELQTLNENLKEVAEKLEKATDEEKEALVEMYEKSCPKTPESVSTPPAVPDAPVKKSKPIPIPGSPTTMRGRFQSPDPKPRTQKQIETANKLREAKNRHKNKKLIEKIETPPENEEPAPAKAQESVGQYPTSPLTMMGGHPHSEDEEEKESAPAEAQDIPPTREELLKNFRAGPKARIMTEGIKQAQEFVGQYPANPLTMMGGRFEKYLFGHPDPVDAINELHNSFNREVGYFRQGRHLRTSGLYVFFGAWGIDTDMTEVAKWTDKNKVHLRVYKVLHPEVVMALTTNGGYQEIYMPNCFDLSSWPASIPCNSDQKTYKNLIECNKSRYNQCSIEETDAAPGEASLR